MSNSHIEVNVTVNAAGKQRILKEEAFWTGPRLTALLIAVLGCALAGLYLAAGDIPDPHPWPYFPWEGPSWR